MYVPQMEGEYRVIIKFGEKEINRSPFKVLVEGAAGDASKVTASGPGLEKTGVVVSKKTYFEVFTKGKNHHWYVIVRVPYCYCICIVKRLLIAHIYSLML